MKASASLPRLCGTVAPPPSPPPPSLAFAAPRLPTLASSFLCCCLSRRRSLRRQRHAAPAMEELFRRHDVGGLFGGLDEAKNPPVAAPCGLPATTSSETEKHVSCGSSVPSPSALLMKELRDMFLKDLPHDHPSEAMALHKPRTSARKNSKMKPLKNGVTFGRRNFLDHN